MSALTLQHRIHSKVDRTQKLIYTLTSSPSVSSTIEVSVIDKQDGKKILCVPTQTNCAQACKFCFTTEMAGKVKVNNLSAEEIISIVWTAYYEAQLDATDDTLLISFMGVGEPMANSVQLMDAIALIHYDCVRSHIKVRFALSTMLPLNHVADFKMLTSQVAARKLPVKIHLSLHYTMEEQRQQYMPTAAPIFASIDLLEDYRRITGNPVEIHYTLMRKVNDSAQDVLRLITLLQVPNIPVKFLRYNPVPGDTVQSPDEVRVSRFRNFLRAAGVTSEWYDSPGADIAAACGMFLTDAYLTPSGLTVEESEGVRSSEPMVHIAIAMPMADTPEVR